MKNPVYYISALGCDERAFVRNHLDEFDAQYLPWKTPQKGEDLSGYASRYADELQGDHKPILVGLSFGGILAIEIGKFIETEKIIIISSTWHRNKMKRVIRMNRYLPAYRYLHPSILHRFVYSLGPYYGKLNKEETRWYRQMTSDFPRPLTKWILDKVVKWKNVERPSNLIQIQGDRDHLFPVPDQEAIVIKGGTHFMIAQRAD